MEKQYVRKIQQMGNGLGIRIAPELLQEMEMGRGDDCSMKFNPESRGLNLSKVVSSDSSPGSDKVLADGQTDSQADDQTDGQTDSQADSQADNQAGEETKIEFCSNCGSKDIDVTGNKYYCQVCDALFEFTTQGTKVIKLSPLAGEIEDIEQRLEQVESDVQEIDEQLNQEPDEEEVDFLDEDEDKPWGFVGELVGAVFGSGKNKNKSEDEDDDDL